MGNILTKIPFIVLIRMVLDSPGSGEETMRMKKRTKWERRKRGRRARRG